MIFIFGMARADLLLKPAARIVVAVAQQNRARRNPSDKIQQVLAVGVRRQVKILNFAMAR